MVWVYKLIFGADKSLLFRTCALIALAQCLTPSQSSMSIYWKKEPLHMVGATFSQVLLLTSTLKSLSQFWFSSSLVCLLYSVQSLSCVWHFAIPWTAAHQAFQSITNSWSLPKLMPIESVMPSNHLIFCHPFLLLPSIFPNIRGFSNE